MTTARTYVLDADILSYILGKRVPVVAHRLRKALAANAVILVCPVAYFQVKRILLKRNATRQLRFLENLTAQFVWTEFERADWEEASETWAQRQRVGRPVEDSDLLIATYARRRGAVVVTNNERHFVDLGVTVENWTA